MPTRTRASTQRPPRTSQTPSLAGNNRLETLDESTPEVTQATLERREIPSFSEDRAARIAEAAYWRAERRGFAAGHELDDWLEAEKEIDQPER